MARRIFTRYALTPMLFGLVGCAGPHFVSPRDALFGSRFAEITFGDGVPEKFHLGYALSQIYYVKEEGSEDSFYIKFVNKTLLFPVNKKITIIATITRSYGAPGVSRSGNNTCKNSSSFVPQENSKYRILQKGSAFGPCFLEITDLATGKTPVGVEVLKFPVDSQPK